MTVCIDGNRLCVGPLNSVLFSRRYNLTQKVNSNGVLCLKHAETLEHMFSLVRYNYQKLSSRSHCSTEEVATIKEKPDILLSCTKYYRCPRKKNQVTLHAFPQIKSRFPSIQTVINHF